MTRPLCLSMLIVGSVCVGCALLGANIAFGELNQDEGWYLYAARMVSLGEMPYRDFAYTQTPVMPFVYSLAQPFVRIYGLLAGRVFTAALGFAGALIAAWLAARLVGPGKRLDAALLAFMLILVNVYQTYFCAVVKTYALTALFLVAGFLVLSVALDRRSRLAAVLSAALLVLAAGTRTSTGIVLPIVFVFLCSERNSRAFHGWVYFALGGLLSACVVVLPFLLMAPESFWFCVVSYHTLRASGDIWQTLIYKAGFLSRLLGAYFVAVALWLAVVAGQWFQRRNQDMRSEPVSCARVPASLSGLIWASVAAVTLVHLFAPFPYDDYQVLVFPLFAVAVAAMAVRFVCRMKAMLPGCGVAPSSPAESNTGPARDGARAGTGPAGLWLLFVVFCLCLGASVSSSINQDWFVQGRDRIWWRLKDQTSLSKLRETGAMIRSMTRPGDLLLTQDPYLAVESGLMLPRGLEMGQFSYFPEFSKETAEKFHVMNYARMKDLLSSCDAPVAALSGYAFAICSPQIEPVAPQEQAAFREIVERRYELLCAIPNFGQAFTTLRILKKRDE